MTVYAKKVGRSLFFIGCSLLDVQTDVVPYNFTTGITQKLPAFSKRST